MILLYVVEFMLIMGIILFLGITLVAAILHYVGWLEKRYFS